MRFLASRNSACSAAVVPGADSVLDVGGLHAVRQARLADPEVSSDLLEQLT
jgi:hypothetical protein